MERSLSTAVWRNLVAKAVCADSADSPSYSGSVGLISSDRGPLLVSGEQGGGDAAGVSCLDVSLTDNSCSLSNSLRIVSIFLEISSILFSLAAL